MTADNPPLVPTGASLPSSTGSPLRICVRSTRPSSASTLSYAPAGIEPAGHGMTEIIDAFSGWPRSRSRVATTTPPVLAAVFCWLIHCAARTIAATPAITDSSSIISALVPFIAFPCDARLASPAACARSGTLVFAFVREIERPGPAQRLGRQPRFDPLVHRPVAHLGHQVERVGRQQRHARLRVQHANQVIG